MTSAFIEQSRKEAAKASERPIAIKAALHSLEQLAATDLPPIWMMNVIDSHDHEHFVSSMRGLFPEFVNRAKLTAESNILDIGCGCGRLAIPFSYFTDSGSYWGVDVWDEGIEWCKTHISTRKPNFRFETLASNNNYYREAYDASKPNSYKLSIIPDNSLDFAFAISVFTHILEHDSRQYLEELARCLKPTGIAYLTGFVIDRHFFKYVDLTKQHTAVKEVAPGVWQAYQGQDFFAGYTQSKWRSMVEAAGLQIVSYETGSWAEKPGARLYQDTFIIVKA